MDKKICKGCSAQVAKPIGCNSCSIAAHPACIIRTGHPYANGQFLDCAAFPSSNQLTIMEQSLMKNVEDLIKSEFGKFLSEARELHRQQIEDINSSFQRLSQRVTELETKVNKFSSSSTAVGDSSFYEEVLTEMRERESKSCNLIMYDLAELPSAQSSLDHASFDVSMVKDILKEVSQLDFSNIRTSRIGKTIAGKTRPIRVTFPSKDNVRVILKNKRAYSGPVKIYEDRTFKQRQHLRNLQEELKQLVASGVADKTIRYIQGVPKIVTCDSRPTRKN